MYKRQLFHLGEMVNATQSVADDTLQVLGAELNYNIEVVSPEDEDRELLELSLIHISGCRCWTPTANL